MLSKLSLGAAAALCGLQLAAAQDPAGYLISFGNSYTQTGFDINGAKASQANPLGNPDLPGWTTTGGLNWVGQLVTAFNNGVVYSYNFADGGATVDASIVPPYTETVKSLADQVENYSGTLGTKPDYAPWTPENAIVAVWIGVNDVGNSWYQPDAQDIATRVVARYFELLQDIYATGIRQFALLNVPRKFRSFFFSSFTPNASSQRERGSLTLTLALTIALALAASFFFPP
ncbi:hypothetical protein N3K66_001103 [Trichothecium roseum]|uniref:Uncharacterized protein n=1 Tax=Trichothecium roseum TaxID=47278 RepID=A0ACC0VED7_9HYPO|nr:hypothetical protein N3K66_001103 [Trichothecium roseum]